MSGGSVAAGNANAVARRILEKLPAEVADGDTRVSYTQDRHVFHILRGQDGLVFLCMADASFGRESTEWHLPLLTALPLFLLTLLSRLSTQSRVLLLFTLRRM